MNFTFENQGTNTYLVYAVQPEDSIDTMSLGMLTNNKILGLAQTMFTQMDTTKYIKYNISAHVSVKQFFSGSVNKKRLIGVFKGIVNAMLSAEDYMIDTHSILMDMDYIFADVSTCETVLICLPIVEVEKNQVELGSFFKNIMFSTQFDSTENCDYVAKIINYLNSAPMFSLNEFKAVLDGIDEATQTKPVVQAKVQPVVTAPVQKKAVETPTVATPAQPVASNPVQQVATSKTVTPPAEQKQVPKAPVTNVPEVPTPPAQRMAVPNQAPAVPKTANATPTVNTGDEISWFYLMQHYNKENAAKYKAQKEAKKAKKNVPPAPKNSGAFTVPGAPVPPAQPVQQNTAPQNKGFAVPGQPAQATVTNIPPQQVQQPAQAQVLQQPVNASAQPAYQAPVQNMNFGETTVLGGGNAGETTVLGATSAQAQIQPHLIRTKNNEKILLNKPAFRIGKEKSYVDYFIGDNTAISRSHANILTRDGEYFVVDTNSTNHTYVNGTMIQSGNEVKLNHGDKIRLANEDFEFKLY